MPPDVQERDLPFGTAVESQSPTSVEPELNPAKPIRTPMTQTQSADQAARQQLAPGHQSDQSPAYEKPGLSVTQSDRSAGAHPVIACLPADLVRLCGLPSARWPKHRLADYVSAVGMGMERSTARDSRESSFRPASAVRFGRRRVLDSELGWSPEPGTQTACTMCPFGSVSRVAWARRRTASARSWPPG